MSKDKKYYWVEVFSPEYYAGVVAAHEVWARSKKEAARLARRLQRHEYGRHLKTQVFREEK